MLAGIRGALRSARARILGLQVVLLLLALLGAVLATRQVLLVRLDDRITRELTVEVAQLRTLAAGADPATGEPFTDVRALLRLSLERNILDRDETELALVDGEVAVRSSEPAPARLDQDADLVAQFAASNGGELRSADTDAGEIRYAAVPVTIVGSDERGVFVAAVFRDREVDEVDEVVGVLLLSGMLAVLLATAVATVLAGRVLRPVRQVHLAAADITESDLSRRIDVDDRARDDVSEMARTFNRMLDRLQAGFTSQRRFVDDAGHELRTPLTVVRGHLELMPEEPAARAATIALLLDELDRMARIVDELLSLATAERPGFVQPGTVDLGQLLDEVEAKVVVLADREWQMEERATGVVPGDRQRLTQALVQLAANAAQHTRDGDDVWFGSARTSSGVRLWFRDSGAGFVPADRERVFDRFARGTDAARASDGAGLGLSIVRAIAEGHGGSVRVVEGSTVEIVIPS